MPIQTATTITMPQLGESVTEGTIGAWLKQVGDRIEKYDLLVEVETDKVNTEIPSPYAGVLVEILIDPATTVPVGTALCRIEQGQSDGVVDEPGVEAPEIAAARGVNGHGAASPLPVRRPEEIPDEMELLRARSSPVVRRIAEEHGVDVSQIDGSGVGGRVTKQDILAFIEQAPAPVGDREAVAATQAVTTPPELRTITDRSPIKVFPGDEVIPVTPMRRLIAEHMVRSERTAPHVTCVMEVDMTNVVALRAAHKEGFARREGIDLTYLPFAIKAATLALRDHPRLNAVWDEERIIHRGAINVGVAVALDDGLIVPVIKHADRLSIAGLMHAVADLAARARAGSLTPDDVTGGTFTVNNPGAFGSLVSTPILVQPQVAILSTEAIIKRPVVIDDMIAIRSMMNLSLSVDHRAVDGLAATRFLQTVKRWLEGVDERLSLY